MSELSDPNVIYKGDVEESFDYSSVGDLLVKRFKMGGNKVALINGHTDKKWTFNDILMESTKMARALHGSGIRANDVIAILAENRLDYTSISYGTLLLNAVVAPTNITYTERELKHSLSISKPKFVFISNPAKHCLEVVKYLSYVEKIILMDDENIDQGRVISLKRFVEKYGQNNFDVEAFVRKPLKIFEQPAVIFMSSGTTGMPKGVELSHGNLIACAANNLERLKISTQIFENIISLTVAPWFHAMGFMGKFLTSTSALMSSVFLVKFEPELYLRSIEKYKILIMSASPPLVLFLAKTPLFHKFDLSSLKLLVCGAAPLSRDLEDQIRKRFNDEILVVQAYGQTELTLGVLYCNYATAKPGSVGEVVNGTYAKVIDEKGKSLGPNKVGELCFKGPLMMKGYKNNKEATSSTIDSDGWLHTGDLGYYDEDHQFFIVDRLKELIKYKAFQVPPAEIEGLLISNPKIKDAGVIGIPDENAGELPFAFVVKEAGCDLTEEEVKDFVKNNISNPKWLRGGVKFIDEIPKNPSGKILRKEMKELYKSMKSKL